MTVVEGNSSRPFSLATPPRCRGRHATPFLGLSYLTLDPYLVMLSVKQGRIKYHFLTITPWGLPRFSVQTPLFYKRYGSRVKWSNPGNGVAPSPTPRCSSYWKWSLWVTLDNSYQFTKTYLRSSEDKGIK